MLQSLNEKGEYNGRYNKTTLDMYAMFASTCLYFLLWLSDVLYSNSKVIMYSLQFVLDNYVERVHQKNKSNSKTTYVHFDLKEIFMELRIWFTLCL